MDPNATALSNPNESIKCIAFEPNGYRLVGGNESGNLRQWMVGSEKVNSFVTKATHSVSAIAVSMDGRWIVSGDTGNKVIIWNAATYTIARQFLEHTGSVYAVDVSSDSARVASGSDDRTVRIFNIISGVRVIPPLSHTAAAIAVKFSPDESRIATVEKYGFASVYDAQTGNKLFYISVQFWTITSLAWSLNGQQLFIASPSKITSIEMSTSSRSEWFIQNGEYGDEDADEDAGGGTVSIVAHDRFIACSADYLVSFWDYASQQRIGSIGHMTPVNCISISHDGRYLACGRDNVITIHSLADFLPQDYLPVPLVSRFPLVQMSDAVHESWMLGNPTETELSLSAEIAKRSNPGHHAFTARSLMRTRLRKWKTAIEDAEMSLRIERSPIGQIARSLALVGAGKHDAALDDFDFVFCDCDQRDNMLLLVIKSIFLFVCGKYEQAVSRLRNLITAADEKKKSCYMQVLGYMYLKGGDHENAVQTLRLAKNSSTSEDSNPLMTISLIFNWNFDHLEVIAWKRLCGSLYTSGRIKDVGETLVKMVSSLAEDEKEPAHGRILEEIVTRSAQVTLLAWTGKSSTCNSCLPSSPAVYSQEQSVPPRLEAAELEKRTDELRADFPLEDALVIYGRVTSVQPVRFAHFRLLLPCIVFSVRSLTRGQANVYHAETTGLGNVEFITADPLPLEEPWRLVFADLRVHGLLEAHGAGWAAAREGSLESDAQSNMSDTAVGSSIVDTDAELVHAPIIEEAPQPLDTYTRALQLIAHLDRPFSALLLLRQSDGAYRRVAADHEIIVGGTGRTVTKAIRVEVLEIL